MWNSVSLVLSHRPIIKLTPQLHILFWSVYLYWPIHSHRESSNTLAFFSQIRSLWRLMRLGTSCRNRLDELRHRASDNARADHFATYRRRGLSHQPSSTCQFWPWTSFQRILRQHGTAWAAIQLPLELVWRAGLLAPSAIAEGPLFDNFHSLNLPSLRGSQPSKDSRARAPGERNRDSVTLNLIRVDTSAFITRLKPTGARIFSRGFQLYDELLWDDFSFEYTGAARLFWYKFMRCVKIP